MTTPKPEDVKTETPTVHWASSDAPGGKCWCGEAASPTHAAAANKSARVDSADTKAWRQG